MVCLCVEDQYFNNLLDKGLKSGAETWKISDLILRSHVGGLFS
jgi:hypothetical protein